MTHSDLEARLSAVENKVRALTVLVREINGRYLPPGNVPAPSIFKPGCTVCYGRVGAPLCEECEGWRTMCAGHDTEAPPPPLPEPAAARGGVKSCEEVATSVWKMVYRTGAANGDAAQVIQEDRQAWLDEIERRCKARFGHWLAIDRIELAFREFRADALR